MGTFLQEQKTGQRMGGKRWACQKASGDGDGGRDLVHLDGEKPRLEACARLCGKDTDHPHVQLCLAGGDSWPSEPLKPGP